MKPIGRAAPVCGWFGLDPDFARYEGYDEWNVLDILNGERINYSRST